MGEKFGSSYTFPIVSPWPHNVFLRSKISYNEFNFKNILAKISNHAAINETSLSSYQFQIRSIEKLLSEKGSIDDIIPGVFFHLRRVDSFGFTERPPESIPPIQASNKNQNDGKAPPQRSADNTDTCPPTCSVRGVPRVQALLSLQAAQLQRYPPGVHARKLSLSRSLLRASSAIDQSA